MHNARNGTLPTARLQFCPRNSEVHFSWMKLSSVVNWFFPWLSDIFKTSNNAVKVREVNWQWTRDKGVDIQCVQKRHLHLLLSRMKDADSRKRKCPVGKTDVYGRLELGYAFDTFYCC